MPLVIPDDDRKQRLAYAIRAVMASQGLSPEDVAGAIEPSKSAETIARWRRGQTTPSAVDVGPLARALGVKYGRVRYRRRTAAGSGVPARCTSRANCSVATATASRYRKRARMMRGSVGVWSTAGPHWAGKYE